MEINDIIERLVNLRDELEYEEMSLSEVQDVLEDLINDIFEALDFGDLG